MKVWLMKREAAEILALGALGWVASEDDRMAAFLAASGAAPAELAGRTQEPELLASVLDFVLSDDLLVIGFAGHAGIAPASVAAARAALPGGAAVHWT
jgi:hypothetical protein